MIKKLMGFIGLLIRSGVLFHRSTFVGVLCGSWIFFGAVEKESVFQRMLTLDLYLFMFAFLVLYRILFGRVYVKGSNEKILDFQGMGFYLLGDMAWATLAMFCTVPFFMMFDLAEGYGTAQTMPPDVKMLIQKQKALNVK